MNSTVPKQRRTRHYKPLTIHLSRVRETTGIHAASPKAIRDYFRDVADLAQEAFWTVTLNTKNKIINRHMVSLGVVDATIVHPREVIRPAIQDSARALVIVHNHPGGNVEPSDQDIAVSHQIYWVARLIEIELLDSVIIARRGKRGMRHYSLRESGHLDRFRNDPLPGCILTA